VLAPTTITFSARSQTGVGAVAAYAGRLTIATSSDGHTLVEKQQDSGTGTSRL
jgi:hypothetical protein